MDAFVRRQSTVGSGSESSRATPPVDDPGDRPAKRVKTDEINDSEASDGSFTVDYGDADYHNGFEDAHQAKRVTEIENALPPTQADDEAIEAYEEYKSSQKSQSDEPKPKENPLWINGRSSIYVDAFNLALDTVLDEESQLFDDKELDVFKHWKQLCYESQYLYVRLFLRKTAAWHRTNRLGYYNDISDPEAAIKDLQMPRMLEHTGPQAEIELPSVLNYEEQQLDDTITFADSSDEQLTSVEEAGSLLLLDELKLLTKDAKIQGKNKADLIKGLCRAAQQQRSLTDLGLRRHSSSGTTTPKESTPAPGGCGSKLERENSGHGQLLFNKIMDILGPCVRISQAVFKLFERVHLVFYRSTEWTEKSLTTIILAKIARRNFPEYIVCRTATIFASRSHLVEFESAIRLEAQVDQYLEGSGRALEKGFERVAEIFESVYPRWQMFIKEEAEKEETVYEMGEGAYLRRFNPAHPYTRIIVKSTLVFARFKDHAKEHALLVELLAQRLFHLARRGSWYDRKALLEENYMGKITSEAEGLNLEEQKKIWNRHAVATCEAGLQDPNCHLIYLHSLQKRLLKLEKRLRVPRRLQHDFGHVRLSKPLEVTVRGIQIKRDVPPKPGALAASTRTTWLDELDSGGECTVEEMCLSYFRAEGWKGYHAEGGIIRTLFAYLFYDILFLYIPNVFQTAYQTCPLDLHTDAFMPARASEINHRLVEIANGDAERILREVWQREHERRTAIVGLNWDFEVDDLAELVACFDGSALSAICKVMAEEYGQRGGGIPDLILWRKHVSKEPDDAASEPGKGRGEVMFAEVKSENDRLSETQRLWIHVLSGAGIQVTLCNALAKEVREVD